MAQEVNTALLDGHVDESESMRIRREIAHARKMLDALEVDLVSHK